MNTAIDGQQRLTTVTIIICAIGSLLPRETAQYRKLTKLLVNEDDEELDYYKLLPTQPDREAFQALVNEEDTELQDFQKRSVISAEAEERSTEIRLIWSGWPKPGLA